MIQCEDTKRMPAKAEKKETVSGLRKKKIKRVMGIEPTYPAWKAGVLPLNYTRVIPDTSDILS